MTFVWPANGDLAIVSSSESINIFDSIDCVYSSPWSGLNLTLFCGSGGFSAQATSVTYWWNVPYNPLSGSGTYRMDLFNSGFATSIKVWPAPCFLRLTQYGDNDVAASGKQFSVISQAGQSSTYTASLTSSTASAGLISSASSATTSTLSSTSSNSLNTSVTPSSSSSQSSNPSASTNSPTSAKSQNSELSTGAKAGIAAGAILAVIIIILLAWVIALLRRKRRTAHEMGKQPELSAINDTNPVYHDHLHKYPASSQYYDRHTSQPQELGPGAIRRELP